MLGLLVWIDLEYFSDAFIMVPLLQKFFTVCRRVSFDEILELR
jgi:hypothetical protein